MSPPDIIAKVPSCYEKGLSSGDLLFFKSSVHKHRELDIEFEIRLCPALQKKPTTPSTNFSSPSTEDSVSLHPDQEKKVDPFAPPYNPNLYVGDLRDENNEEDYVVLLNKYSVVPQHFLLVSKEFKSQWSPLMPSELLQSYLLIAAARKARRELFAFYNCGDNSGASQPHKHLQFLPLEDEDGPPIEILAKGTNLETPDKPFTLSSLPYANHVYRFPQRLYSSSPDKIEEVLAQAFLSLLDLGISTIRHDPTYPSGRPSYNVIITLEHMYFIPRRQESYTLESGDKLSVNALGFSGMLLVKSEAELEAVKKEKLENILSGVGLKSVDDLLIAGTSLEAPPETL